MADKQLAYDTVTADLAGMGLTALTNHMVATHHRFLKERLPHLVPLAQRVAEAHGAKHPSLIALADVVQRFTDEMMAHLTKEEQVLFPFCRQLETDPASLMMPPQFVAQPVRVMQMEHESATADLAEMRRLSDGYRAPDDACGSYRALMQGLAELETDTQIHMQIENDLLFPRAVNLAQSLASPGAVPVR